MKIGHNRFPLVVLCIALACSLMSMNAGASLLSGEGYGAGNAFMGGTVDCSTRAAYDVDSLLWHQTGQCDVARLHIRDPDTHYLVEEWQVSIAALVDNSGQVLGGTFAAFGSLPAFGLEDSLLLTGTLLDVYYGSGGRCCATAVNLRALIELDFAVAPFAGLGSFLEWEGNVDSGPWGWGHGCTPSGEDPAHPGSCSAWETSVSASQWSNFTGSVYYFLDGSVPVPEPGPLALLISGLVGIALSRRRIPFKPA